MSAGSKRRKVTVDIKPQNKFDRGSVFERLGGQSRDKQKKYKDTAEVKVKSRSQPLKAVDGDHVAKPIKISRTSGIESAPKKPRETEVVKYNQHDNEKSEQPLKAHKRSGNHKSKFSPDSGKNASKHKGDEISTSRIRKMDNLIIEKRVSPSSSSIERSRSSSPSSLRSRKKAKKHISKHEHQEEEYERRAHRSKSPEPSGKKRGKERGRSREPKKTHKKAYEECDDVYEQHSPGKSKHATQKKKAPKYDRHEKPDKKSVALSERKMKTKGKKADEWDEDVEEPCSQGESGDEPLREDEDKKSSNKKESKKHSMRELKRAGNAPNEEPLKTKRRKYEDALPPTSPSHSKKTRVSLTDDTGVREKYAQAGKKAYASKSSSKKKHKDDNLVPKKKQKDGSLQRTYSDFSSSSKYSQVEYSEHSDYVEEHFSDEMSLKEKRKKMKKKKKDKDYEVYATTDKSGYENEDIEATDIDRQMRKPLKKRKHKRESRSPSMSGSEIERTKGKRDVSGDIRIKDKKKKDAYAHAGENKMEVDGRYRHREVENSPSPKYSARDDRSSKETHKLLTPPDRSHRGDIRLGLSREGAFQGRSRSSHVRDEASADRSQRDYDVTKRSRLSESSPKRTHGAVSPHRSFEGDMYRDQSRKDLSAGHSCREDVTSRLSYRNNREGTSPRSRDGMKSKEPHRDSMALRRRAGSPGHIRREDISVERRDRERVSPVHQVKHSHTANRKSVLVEERDFLHDGRDTNRKAGGHLSKHATSDQRYSTEHEDDYSRRNRSHRSTERPRARDWEASQGSHQETSHRREATRRLPDRNFDTSLIQSKKYVFQRKLEHQSAAEVLPPDENYQSKASWERKADRRSAVSSSRRVPSLLERDFQKPEFSQSGDRPKGTSARSKYLDTDRSKLQQERKFQDKSWVETTLRTDQEHQYLISQEDKNRRMRSGSRDSRSSSQHSRDVGRLRTFDAGPRDSSPRSAALPEYNKHDRAESDGRSHALGKHADVIHGTSLRGGAERQPSAEHRNKSFRKIVTHPSRDRSLEKNSIDDARRGPKNQRPSLKRHGTGSLKGRSSSSSRSSQSRDRAARKTDVSPRRTGNKIRRKAKLDANKASSNHGQKRVGSNQRGRERKQGDATTDGELAILIDQNGGSKASTPEAGVTEVDWTLAGKPMSPGDVKEPSSVLQQFTPENILRTTGIATELLSQSILKKLNQVYHQNSDVHCEDVMQPVIRNIMGASLHSYSDMRLRRTLLGHNLRYRHRMVLPAVLNAKTYSACMKNYMSTCKVAV